MSTPGTPGSRTRSDSTAAKTTENRVDAISISGAILTAMRSAKPSAADRGLRSRLRRRCRRNHSEAARPFGLRSATSTRTAAQTSSIPEMSRFICPLSALGRLRLRRRLSLRPFSATQTARVVTWNRRPRVSPRCRRQIPQPKPGGAANGRPITPPPLTPDVLLGTDPPAPEPPISDVPLDVIFQRVQATQRRGIPSGRSGGGRL